MNGTIQKTLSGLLIAVLALLSFALPAGADSRASWPTLADQGRAIAHGGEGCVACGAPVEEGTEIPFHRGRAVPICEPCLDMGAWEGKRDELFAKLQPKSALFTEASEETVPVLSGWFWFGVYVLAGLVCAAASAYLAVNRAQSPATWFFAGLFGNVAALVVLLFIIPKGDATLLPAGVPSGLAKVPTTREPVVCPSCGRENHPSAKNCSSCGAGLSPSVASEVESAR